MWEDEEQQQPRMTAQQAEAELRRRLREDWMTPEHRRWLRQWLIIGKGHNRYKEMRVEQMSADELLNKWAAAHSDLKLVDLSGTPDRQLFQAISFQDTGTGIDQHVLADSAIAEIRKRANNLRLTVAQYIRRRIRDKRNQA
jgi:hypothetical protein